MAAPHAKKPRTGGPRMSLQLTFGGVVSMEAFKGRLERMKHAFVPEGAPPLKPVDLLNKLFEAHLATPVPDLLR